MTFPATRRLADALVIALIAGWTLWYLADTVSASSRVTNLIFILPVAVLLLGLCGFEALRLLRAPAAPAPAPAAEDDPEDLAGTLKVMALFAAYVLSAERIGFDLATCLFVGLYLLLKGERRPLIVLGYAALFGNLVTLFFARMLPYPMPMAWL
ncbi:tripartite tricarboxylate transporter TctB family protein [Poseidonocella sp. HB161398]|uniref:tripartite tricarboxylate transporter TctB family protein n=1 Tax=Poseidonocella sp. HB161398 TaxID=2320855 RepID=UPI001108BBAB|nr:tripartite tricarboxylate transporter TctB family protein [Poseidonocella sp. HB161398]